MLTEVLKYTKPGCYEVSVLTDSIDSAWARFKGRIAYRNQVPNEKEPSDPYAYCAYGADASCEIAILRPDTQLMQVVAAGEKTMPVIYETNRYQIEIRFENIDHDFTPCARHVRKDVEDFFHFSWDGNREQQQTATTGSLVGSVDFLNEPGLFRLGFQYSQNGRIETANIAFDVVSPKLDVKKDYATILREVNNEFEDYLLRYLSLTVQNLSTGTQRSLEIWMQAFQGLIHDYIKNVERIIKNPHSKVRTIEQFAKADRIKRWSPAMEEMYEEKRRADKLDTHYFRYEVYDNTVNSMENRFVKHTLLSIGKKLQQVFDEVLTRNNTEISDSYRTEWTAYQQKIQHLMKHPFFKAVGRFEGMNHESLVLQSRMGYQQVYKDWLKLNRGIDFYTGATNIGTLQIWEIYELWCFIKVKRMVLDILGIDPLNKELIDEPNGPLVTYDKNRAGDKMDYRVVIQYPKTREQLLSNRQEDVALWNALRLHEGDTLSLHYQHTFSRHGEDDQHIRTLTTEQRPDIILNIHHDNTMLTYLYDAKYRVWSDTKLDREADNVLLLDKDDEWTANFEGADVPPADAINQMHRYRDAIYYSLPGDSRPDSKEVIGGYILFPGRGDEKSISEKFFSKSIETVNIGAFPLLPCGATPDVQGRDSDGPQLYDHLRKVLLENQSAFSHVETAVPQRGLSYVEAQPDNVLVARVKSAEQWAWIMGANKYNLPINNADLPKLMTAEYIVLAQGGSAKIFSVTKCKAEVWTKQQIAESAKTFPTADGKTYQPSSSEAYIVFSLHNKHIAHLQKQTIHLNEWSKYDSWSYRLTFCMDNFENIKKIIR